MTCEQCETLRTDLARLRVREGQLREVVTCARTVVARWKENSEPWPPSAAHLSDALDALSSPPDAPDVLRAIRYIAEHASRFPEKCCESALATLRAAGIVE